MHVGQGPLRVAGDAAVDGGLDGLGRDGVGFAGGEDGEGLFEGRGVLGEGFGDYVDSAAAEEDAVGALVRGEPAGEAVGGLDEEEVAVGVVELDGEGGVEGGEGEEEGDDEPLVVEVVAEADAAVEAGDGGEGWGEEEGVAVPDEGGGEEGGEVGEDAEVEGVE